MNLKRKRTQENHDANQTNPFLPSFDDVAMLAFLLLAMFAIQPAYATTTWSVTVERWDTPNSLTAPTNSPTQNILVDDIGDSANSSIQAVSGYGGILPAKPRPNSLCQLHRCARLLFGQPHRHKRKLRNNHQRRRLQRVRL